MNEPVRILLVDDHAVMRMGLASLLGTQSGIEVIGDAGDGESGIRKTLKLKPDVVIMDLLMPGTDGVEATKRILESAPETRILILTTYSTADAISHALEAGAKGALLKTAELKELLSAIRAINRGETFIAPEIEQMLTENPPLPELSQRQHEVLDSITRGLSNEDIARQLGISLPMVKGHVKALFAKIGAANRTEAVAITLRKHLLKV